MAKKTAEKEESLETVEVKPAEVSADFGRADLNELRDVVNFLLRKG